jgi:hypothetical protein
VNGGFDMRTPLAGASSVAARFPQGQVLVVPGVGHSVVEADASGCAANGVRSWMLGQAIPSSCPRTKQFVPPIGALPAAGSANGKAKGARATYSVAAETIHEAEATWLMNFGFSGTSGSAPGIYGGKLTASTGRDFKLVGYSIARGLKVSGTITVTKFGPPLVFQGTVTVSGATAAPGILVLSGSKVRGTLAGRSVGG